MTSRRPMNFMARQFGGPSGPIGQLVIRLLARGNAAFNRWLVDELSTAVPAPRTVIELGCGPGIALQRLAIAYPDARLIGIDPSSVALKSARRRNASAIAAGRLLVVGGDTATAVSHGPADLVLACHVLYFWTRPADELRRIRQALMPSGHLALGYQLRKDMPQSAQRAFPAEGFTLYESDDDVAAILNEAGFTRPEMHVFGDQRHPMGRLALCAPTSPHAA